MNPPPELSRPEPILVIELFPEMLDQLLLLLSGLRGEQWEAPTVCPGWTVKDVALHLLGVEIGNLSTRRDRHTLPGSISGWDELVDHVNRWNQEWVQSARRISPELLIELLAFLGDRMAAYFRTLDPYAMGGAISWAGPEPRPVWLDIAREYTERWHHQQHIRDAVQMPGLKQPRYFHPVLETFAWAMPHAFRRVAAAPGTGLTLTITGDSGGNWTLVREQGGWGFYQGMPGEPGTQIILDQELAWRFFTRGVRAGEARGQISILGNQDYAQPLWDMVAIIA